MNILEVCHVSRRFGEHEVLKDLSFSVPEHRIFGFIGKNGAGKTTTMKLITGLLRADKGEILVNGKAVRAGENETNQYIVYLPDVPEFYDFMTPAEYLMLCARITGMKEQESRKRICELLKLVGLEDGKRRIHGFSRGMKQRLGIAQALLNRPLLLICDEPTSALDPIGRKEILDILCEVKKETTVLFSTHILSDVERICDEIAYLKNGSAVLQGNLEEIKEQQRKTYIEVEFVCGSDMERFQKQYQKGRSVEERTIRFAPEADILDIMKVLTMYEIPVQRLEKVEPTLEDIFLEEEEK